MDRSAVSQQLDKILRSRTLASKNQLRKLLQVLHQNMESQIITSPDLVIRELWPDEIRTKRAADVATEMNRLRQALKSYYEVEGADDPITISLPNRSVTAGNGTHERPWVVAEPRSQKEEAIEDHPPSLPVNSRGVLRKISVLALLGAALVVGAYIAVRVFAGHSEPSFGRLDGSTLVIFDGEGKELWKKAFPMELALATTTRRA